MDLPFSVDITPMPPTPAITSIIPTRNRASHLRQCLIWLSRQTLPANRHEVIVVLDGPDDASTSAAAEFTDHLGLRVIEAERLGIAHAKNVALAEARGRIVLLLNDDIRPVPTFLEAHLRAHQARSSGPPAMILGHSPFIAPPPDQDTCFDLLIRSTSMIFFYDRMIDADGRLLQSPDHDWGCRHAWNMNLSLPRDAALAIGGFRPAIANCCYEDVEFAWRLAARFGSPVLFRPDARADHDHRYTPDSYLEREYRLGYSAFGVAHAAPEFGRWLFRTDLRTPEAQADAQRSVAQESPGEQPILKSFRALAESPPSRRQVDEAHLRLKRLTFWRGYLHAASGSRIPGLFHPSDGLHAEPPLAPTIAG